MRSWEIGPRLKCQDVEDDCVRHVEVWKRIASVRIDEDGVEL